MIFEQILDFEISMNSSILNFKADFDKDSDEYEQNGCNHNQRFGKVIDSHRLDPEKKRFEFEKLFFLFWGVTFFL